jgi:hypothetical protein
VGNLCAQGQQEGWQRPSCCPVVRVAEERHSPPSDDAAHLEVRKRDIGDRFEEDSLIGVRDEVLAIVEAHGPIAFEELSRRYHDPSCPMAVVPTDARVQHPADHGDTQRDS